jgi:transposase
MTQRDRDRLVALKKARKGLITQKQAAEEIGQSERHVRRLLKRLKGKGDGALHALRGCRSNRKLDEVTKQKALEILSRDVYRGFGPTLAAEYLAGKHDIHAGRETVRTWMIEGKLCRASRQRVDKIHQWRPRRSWVKRGDQEQETVVWHSTPAVRAGRRSSRNRAAYLLSHL